jgi:hypothetical protein
MMTDDQARALVQRVGPLLDQYPINAKRKDHRPFAGAFMRAVFEVTGKMYGPDIYRRLLKAYAPGRNPSITTLASERDNVADQVTREKDEQERAARRLSGMTPAASYSAPVAAESVRAVLAEFLPQLARLAGGNGKEVESHYLKTRLDNAERLLYEAQTQATHAGAQLQEQVALVAVLQSELLAAHNALHKEQENIKRLTEEVTGQRTFALQSIELSRAETRLIKERATTLEQQVRTLETTVDQLRMARGNAAAGAMR